MNDSELENRHGITLLIECSDDKLASEVKDDFGANNVSQSSNFIGGTSIAVFLLASLKAMQPTIKSILEFLSRRRDRYEDASIVYDGKKISLKGYGPDDAEKILSNSVFDKLRS